MEASDLDRIATCVVLGDTRRGWEYACEIFPYIAPEDVAPLTEAARELYSGTILDGLLSLFRDGAFEMLARGQRGEPEQAMLEIQHAQIAQEYGYVCEHVGDLTHRMSEHWSFFRGSYAIPKIERTLRILSDLFKFSSNIDRQIASNLRFCQEEGKPFFASAFEARSHLQKLGQAYGQAHMKLPVWNRPQWLARQAAVSLGFMNFASASRYLSDLRDLAADSDRWEAEAGAFDGKLYSPPSPPSTLGS